MRFLLLQARNAGDPAAPHEVSAFQAALHTESEQITPWDLLQGKPPGALLDEHDCVLVGGSGEFGIGDQHDHAWLREFIDYMGELGGRGVPTFASCFGFQALVVAGGGEVETDKSRAEVGTFELHVTEEGKNDPLFGPLAPTFLAQLGHKDHATRLPGNVVHLAGSERSPHQALRVRGKPIYATQFHPELSMTLNRERFLRYLEAYSEPDMIDPPEAVMARFRESQGATALLRAFVDQVLAPHRAESQDAGSRQG